MANGLRLTTKPLFLWPILLQAKWLVRFPIWAWLKLVEQLILPIKPCLHGALKLLKSAPKSCVSGLISLCKIKSHLLNSWLLNRASPLRKAGVRLLTVPHLLSGLVKRQSAYTARLFQGMPQIKDWSSLSKQSVYALLLPLGTFHQRWLLVKRVLL